MALLVFTLMGSDAHAAAISPGNLLISTSNQIYEYTPQGTYVQNFSVEYPGGYPSTEYARDIAAKIDGKVYVYNGTFYPYMSTYDSNTSAWSHVTSTQFSTVNNGSYGGIDAYDTTVFVTDMMTYSGGQAQGVIAFNTVTGQVQRFAGNIEPIDLTLGLDGLLYTLSPGGSPCGTIINIYNPSSLASINSIDLSRIFGWTEHRSIAVDYNGDIFVADWDGDVQHLSKTGRVMGSIDINRSIMDIDISKSGKIALGTRFGEVFLTDTDFSTITPFAGAGPFVEFAPDFTPLTRVLTNPTESNGLSGWFKTNPNITLTADVTAATFYSWDDTVAMQTYSGPIQVPSDGGHTLFYHSVHASGTTETIRQKSFQVDTELPDEPVVGSSSHALGQSSATNTIDVYFSSIDEVSGLAGYSFSWSQASETPDNLIDLAGDEESLTSNPFADGTWYFNVKARDRAGNWSPTVNFGPFIIDTPPVTNATFDPEFPDGDAGWYLNNPTITLSSDQTGTTYYSWDATRPIEYVAPITVSSPGRHTLGFSSVDEGGQIEATQTLEINVDTVLPSAPGAPSSQTHVVGEISGDKVIIADFAAATDTISGIDGYATSWSRGSQETPPEVIDTTASGAATETASSAPLGNGAWYFNVSAKDKAGNWGPAEHLGPFYIRDESANPLQLTFDSLDEVNAVFSPDGRKIVFTAYDPNYVTGDIWIMDADGTNRVNLTNTPDVNEFNGGFSPDGLFIVYSAFAVTGRSDIWRMGPNGSEKTNLTNTPIESEFAPLFNSSGSVVYTKMDPITWNGDIYSATIDGVIKTNLTNTLAGDEWLSDIDSSGRIAFICFNPTTFNGDVWIMNNDGGGKANLTITDNTDESEPIFSPDGTKVSYVVSSPTDYTTDIWLMNADGSAKKDLTNVPGQDEYNSAFSPDGGRIAYTVGNPDFFTEDIWLMTATGTEKTNLTNTPFEDEWNSRFSLVGPDGRIVFHEEDEVEGDINIWFYLVDLTPPVNPETTSTSHFIDFQSNDNTIDIGLTDATDTGSGVDGFSILWSESAGASPDKTKDFEENTTKITSRPLADGDWYFTLRTRDNAGNWSTVSRLGPFIIETGAPTTSFLINPTGPNANDGWYTIKPQITLMTTEALTRTIFRWDCDSSGSTTFTAPFNSPEGVHTLEYFSIDRRNNTETAKTKQVKTDLLPPADPVLSSLSHTVGQWSNDTTVEVGLSGATDTASGVDGFSISWTQNTTGLPDATVDVSETSTNIVSPPLADGEWWFNLRTRDKVGHLTSTAHIGPFMIDTVVPTGQITVNGNRSYTSSPGVALSLVASDPIGHPVSQVRLKNDDSDWSPWQVFSADTGWVLPAVDGLHKVIAQYRDVAGNISPEVYDEIFLDMVSPIMTSISAPANAGTRSTAPEFLVSWGGIDPEPGAGLGGFDVEYKVGAGGIWIRWMSRTAKTVSLFKGASGDTYYVRARAADKLGNIGQWSSVKKTIVPYDQDSLIAGRAGFSGIESNNRQGLYMNTVRYSRRPGAAITYNITGNELVLMTTTGLRRAKADIFIDGKYVDRVDAYSVKTTRRYPIFKIIWPRIGRHRIKIVNRGAPGRSRFDIDALAVGR